MARLVSTTVLGIVLLAVAVPARAHEDPSDRIHALTHRIEKRPGDARLYVERGRLELVEGRWSAAVADFDAAIALEPKPAAGVHRLRAEALLGEDRPSEALSAADASLGQSPSNGAALLVRARALARLDRSDEAVAAYTRALSALETPRPEHYLERARMTREIGAAVDGLDEGMAQLGAVVSLETEAVELECARAHYDAALERVDRLVRRANRPERWWLLRADVLERAGRRTDAARSVREALAALERLPARHRSTEASQRLEAEARARLALACTAWSTALP